MRIFLTVVVCLFILACENRPFITEDSYIVRSSIRKAKGYDDSSATPNYKNFVYNGNISWSGNHIYAKLIPANYFDNTTANSTLNGNGFGVAPTAPCQLVDPLNVVGTGSGCTSHGYKNVFEVPAEYETMATLSTGEDAQNIGYIDFFGVKPGTYDLVAFVDAETELECRDLPDAICTCTRATGCSPEDYKQYEIYKANDPSSITYNPSLCHCNQLVSADGKPQPSNGDVFYVIDNIVVSEENKTKIKELNLDHEGDSALTNSGGTSSDGDLWNEWRCIYNRADLTGYFLHNYQFEDCASSPPYYYFLPGSTDCSTGGELKDCGTMMDYGLDYGKY
ncbi:MAG: hypothetical protein D6767_10015 [Candidatus Hydrogenedentota bacterium]|nr:MAG: hypothetical protein D6767_10015 [Candidatus Hydrogenedentota bacterium]